MEDCIVIFNINLIYEGVVVFVGGIIGFLGIGKVMVICMECCFDFINLDFDQIVCVVVFGDKINLVEYLFCEDICAGDWILVFGIMFIGGSVGIFDDCDNSFIFQVVGEVCFFYDYVLFGINVNEFCGEFYINVCIIFIVLFVVIIVIMVGICDMVNQLNDDVQVNLLGIVNVDWVVIVVVGIVVDYDQVGGVFYVIVVDFMGVISYDFMGLMYSIDYFVWVFNGLDGCYVDYEVIMVVLDCVIIFECFDFFVIMLCYVNGDLFFVGSLFAGRVVWVVVSDDGINVLEVVMVVEVGSFWG